MNVITDKMLLKLAKENIEKYDIVPLYYEMGKAPATPISYKEIFSGLKRAHEYSGIGEVSNKLTRLWAKNDCDRDVAKLLTYYNNLVIKISHSSQ